MARRTKIFAFEPILSQKNSPGGPILKYCPPDQFFRQTKISVTDHLLLLVNHIASNSTNQTATLQIIQPLCKSRHYFVNHSLLSLAEERTTITEVFAYSLLYNCLHSSAYTCSDTTIILENCSGDKINQRGIKYPKIFKPRGFKVS